MALSLSYTPNNIVEAASSVVKDLRVYEKNGKICHATISMHGTLPILLQLMEQAYNRFYAQRNKNLIVY